MTCDQHSSAKNSGPEPLGPPESESDDGSSTNFKLELRVPPAVEFRVAVAAATIAGAQVLD